MNDKPRCPVFGCTIPRSIPHSHPAGVSAVMRDPVAPLNADERSELERFRADLAEMRARGMSSAEAGTSIHEAMLQIETSRRLREEGTYIVRDVPMVPGRKLRDALLMAGHKGGDTPTLEAAKPEPRRSFVRLVGSIAWRLAVVLVVAGLTVLVLAGSRP
nr:hypothetical protein [uncultured Pseudomonas sp.]